METLPVELRELILSNLSLKNLLLASVSFSMKKLVDKRIEQTIKNVFDNFGTSKLNVIDFSKKFISGELEENTIYNLYGKNGGAEHFIEMLKQLCKEKNKHRLYKGEHVILKCFNTFHNFIKKNSVIYTIVIGSEINTHQMSTEKIHIRRLGRNKESYKPKRKIISLSDEPVKNVSKIKDIKINFIEANFDELCFQEFYEAVRRLSFYKIRLWEFIMNVS